jgi:hypothetical protein
MQAITTWLRKCTGCRIIIVPSRSRTGQVIPALFSDADWVKIGCVLTDFLFTLAFAFDATDCLPLFAAANILSLSLAISGLKRLFPFPRSFLPSSPVHLRPFVQLVSFICPTCVVGGTIWENTKMTALNGVGSETLRYDPPKLRDNPIELAKEPTSRGGDGRGNGSANDQLSLDDVLLQLDEQGQCLET